jgi:hypothetical protein
VPKPSSIPEWASSPSDPGDIVEPSGAKKQDGWNASERPPAQYFNWWQNLVYQWVDYLDGWFNGSDEIVYPVAKTRTLRVSPMRGSIEVSGADVSPAWAPGATSRGSLFAQHDEKRLNVVLSDFLPQGAVISLIRVLVDAGGRAGGSRASGDRLQFTVYRITQNWSSPGISDTTIVSTVEDNDSATTAQILTSGAISETVDKAGEVILLEIRSGTMLGGLDRVDGIEVVFTDPGPRNF